MTEHAGGAQAPIGSRPARAARVSSTKDFSQPGDVFLADCPARTTLDVITDKWAVFVVFALGRGPRRHTELRELIGGISKKMLTQTLRKLEGHGLVERREVSDAAGRVEYAR